MTPSSPQHGKMPQALIFHYKLTLPSQKLRYTPHNCLQSRIQYLLYLPIKIIFEFFISSAGHNIHMPLVFLHLQFTSPSVIHYIQFTCLKHCTIELIMKMLCMLQKLVSNFNNLLKYYTLLLV